MVEKIKCPSGLTSRAQAWIVEAGSGTCSSTVSYTHLDVYKRQAERLLDDHLRPATEVGAGRYSTNLLRVIDRSLAVRPELRFRTVAEMQAALDGSQVELSLIHI